MYMSPEKYAEEAAAIQAMGFALIKCGQELALKKI